MNPVIPHFSNECLEMLKNIGFKRETAWPNINKNILQSDEINFVVQINGKTRGILSINIGLTESEVLSLITKNSKLTNYIKNKKIKKTIFISDKLINIIV